MWRGRWWAVVSGGGRWWAVVSGGERCWAVGGAVVGGGTGWGVVVCGLYVYTSSMYVLLFDRILPGQVTDCRATHPDSAAVRFQSEQSIAQRPGKSRVNQRASSVLWA